MEQVGIIITLSPFSGFEIALKYHKFVGNDVKTPHYHHIELPERL